MESAGTTVRIFGQEYTVRSDGDPEYIRRVARYVDERMHEVSSRSSQVSSLRVAILAALNIADELFQVREAGGGPELEKRARELAASLEATIESLEAAADDSAVDDGSSA